MSSPSDLWHAARNPPANPTHLSFHNKAVLVTGANSGLGHASAIKYASLGANPLILAVRTQEKGNQAKSSIIQATNCSPDIFLIETLELTNFASVQKFASRLNSSVPKLHVAQLVAGVSPPTYKKTDEGYEESTQVSVLSTALLAILLLPKLRETARAEGEPSHLSFVNSIAHLDIKPEWIDTQNGETLLQRLNSEAKFDQTTQYYLVKLAAMFIMRGIIDNYARNPKEIIINASCPGMCKTNMGRNHPLGVRIFMFFFYLVLGRSAEAGSRTLVSATGLGEESHGKFWTNDEIMRPSKFMESEEGEQLHRETWNEVLGVLRSHVGDAIP
ncbi:retinol dehydrogenase 14 [Podospora fimiseda]|uniref:Retinol dehydrogenase 14 n=1 Tax=Podospora fimiseda TaxID=252190 RepID=A0AAN6YPW3_9PEZI|nr:retinol dehydrogenase 14 [Podospora fimiseda]